MNDSEKDGKVIGTVEVFGMRHNVAEVADTVWKSQWMGRASTQDLAVYMNPDLKEDARDETLLHEVLHLVSSHMKLEIKEQDVTVLSFGLYSAGCRVKMAKMPAVEERQ